jgi:hypothetical protein
MFESMWLKEKQDSNWVSIRNKGMGRYVGEQIALYSALGLFVMMLLTLTGWLFGRSVLPLSYWIGAVLFAAFCGGLGAWEKWKRGRF